MRSLKCDVLIIGSGAAGGVLAATLAESTDLDILLLEKGGYFTDEFFNQRELDMSVLYSERGRRSTYDGAIPVRGGECVGGGTTVNLALCFDPIKAVWDHWARDYGLREFSFDPTASDYGVAGLNMQSCLREVRARLNVHQVADEKLNDNNRLLQLGCQRARIPSKRFELNMRDCLECGYCAQGCAYHRKQGTMITYVADSLRRGVRLLHHCDVDHILLNRQGGQRVAAGVMAVVRETATGSQPNLIPPGPVKIEARLVISACGAIETPCLLKRSNHPDPHDRIGRGLVLHPSLPVVGIFNRKLSNYRGIAGSVYCDHFYESKGFYLECLFGHPVYGASIIPGFGIDHFETMRQFRRLAGFGIMLVDSPRDGNRVRFNQAGRRPEVHYRLGEPEKERLRFAAQRAIEIMLLAGAKPALLPTEEQLGPLNQARFHTARDAVHCQHLQFQPHQTTITSAHPQATVKMGEDLRRSVVNSRCESQHVRNLVVCDSSVFPTSCGANPMISIMTLARYQGRRIAAELDRYI